MQELGLLHDCWKQVCEGRGRVVLVSGDAGIGKSRLVQALVSQLGDEPHAHLEFRCSANYANSPLYPVVALLPTVLTWSRADGNEARLEKLDAFCARHQLPPGEALPLLASLLSLPASGRYALPPMSPERQKQRTLQLLATIVVSFADRESADDGGRRLALDRPDIEAIARGAHRPGADGSIVHAANRASGIRAFLATRSPT